MKVIKKKLLNITETIQSQSINKKQTAGKNNSILNYSEVYDEQTNSFVYKPKHTTKSKSMTIDSIINDKSNNSQITSLENKINNKSNKKNMSQQFEKNQNILNSRNLTYNLINFQDKEIDNNHKLPLNIKDNLFKKYNNIDILKKKNLEIKNPEEININNLFNNNDKEICNVTSENNIANRLCKIEIKNENKKQINIDTLKYIELNKYDIFNNDENKIKENLNVNYDNIKNIKNKTKQIINISSETEKHEKGNNKLKTDYKNKILSNIPENVKYGIDDSGNPVMAKDFLSKEENKKKIVCYIIENKDKNLKNYLVDTKGNILNTKNSEGDYCYQDDNVYLLIKDFDVQHPQLRVCGHTDFNYENTSKKSERIPQNNETKKNIIKIDEETTNINNESEMMSIWKRRYGGDKKIFTSKLSNISKSARDPHDKDNTVNRTDFILKYHLSNDYHFNNNNLNNNNNENNVNTNLNTNVNRNENNQNNNIIINLSNNISKNQLFANYPENSVKLKNNPLISKNTKSLIKPKININNNPLINNTNKLQYYNTNNFIQIKTKINPQEKVIKKRRFTFIDANYPKLNRKSSLNFIRSNNNIAFSQRNDNSFSFKDIYKIPKGNIKCSVLSNEANQMIKNYMQKRKKNKIIDDIDKKKLYVQSNRSFTQNNSFNINNNLNSSQINKKREAIINNHNYFEPKFTNPFKIDIKNTKKKFEFKRTEINKSNNNEILNSFHHNKIETNSNSFLNKDKTVSKEIGLYDKNIPIIKLNKCNHCKKYY